MGEMRHSRVLDDFAHLLDAPAIENLCACFGGTTLYICKHFPDDHELVKLLGRQLADTLSDEMGGDRFTIPLRHGQRVRVKALAADTNMNHQEIAKTVGIHERQVYRILNEQADDRQGSLPL